MLMLSKVKEKFARRFVLFLSVLLSSAVPGLIFGETVDQLPLKPEDQLPELAAILESAKENAPSFIEQNYILQEGDARLRQAKSAYFPRIDLNSNIGYKREYRSGGSEDRSDFGVTFSARLARPLYHWGAIEARIEQARIRNESSALEYLLNTQRLNRKIRSDYLALLLSQEQLEIEKLKQEQMTSNLEQLENEFQNGTISERDFRTRELDLRSSLLSIDRIEREQQRIFSSFQKQAGWDASVSADEEVPDPEPGKILSWLSRQTLADEETWTTSTPPGRIAQNRIDGQLEQMTVIQAGQRPLINFATTALQDQTNTSTRNNVETLTLFAGISINWNVFDGFRTKHEMIEARLKHRRLEQSIDILSRELEEERTRMLDQIRHQAETNAILETRVEIEKQNFEDLEEEASSGQLSTNQLRQAEIKLRRIGLELNTARAQLLMQLSDYSDLISPAQN